MTGILGGIIGSTKSGYPDLEFISYTSISGSAGSTTASYTLSLPAGVASGDTVIVAVANDGSAGVINTSGYTTVQGDTSTNPGYILGYKYMSGTPDSTVSFNGRTAYAAVAMVFRGVKEIGESAETSGTSGDPNPPSITTTTDNNIILAVGFIDDDDFVSWTAPTGFTKLAEEGFTTGSPDFNGASVIVASRTLATASTIDPAVMTNSGDDAWWSVTVALRPYS